jgi:uncharacterized phage protein (TIGR01671 family)
MSERKFKVWCKNRNEWEKDYVALGIDGRQFHIRHGKELCPVKSDNHIIYWSTGFNDIRGKEIYEGDIVEVNVKIKGIYEDKYKVGVIQYENCTGSYHIVLLGGTSIQLYYVREEFCGFKVIGHVCENPELLGVNR